MEKTRTLFFFTWEQCYPIDSKFEKRQCALWWPDRETAERWIEGYLSGNHYIWKYRNIKIEAVQTITYTVPA